ncbi:unnamed protein product [Nippostrongylus brasiliensis]|uniref:Sema domain-containing protein n=1 Tax=Nippostrongylus brasiliensis TaxID=27835 RepID=A0A0N4XE30_NIPBR|nr:unnamed protein product [Nippostrongylus brasiliensis]
MRRLLVVVRLLIGLLVALDDDGHIISAQHFYYSKNSINNVILEDGKVFVGAVNELAALSEEELLPLHSISTGPIRDSPLCSVDGSSCLKDAVLRDTDNHNKNLSLTVQGDLPVAAISPTASCVSLTLSPSLLAVAVSHSVDSPYREPFPAVALRELPELSVVNAGSLEGEAAVFLRAELRSSFSVRYLNMFHYQHYVFIAAVQAQDTRQTRTAAPMVAKLLRICDNDTRWVNPLRFLSYTYHQPFSGLQVAKRTNE